MIRVIVDRDTLSGYTRRSGQLEKITLRPTVYGCFIKHGTQIDKADYVRRVPAERGWEALTFIDWNHRKQALEKYGSLLFEADVSPAKRFMITKDVQLEAPKRSYVDIETDSRVPPRMQAEMAPGRILCLSLAGEDGGRKRFVLEDDHDDAEAELLTAYWEALNDYDQVCAWFGSSFDFPVLEMRSQKLLRRCDAYWEGRKRILTLDQALCFKRHHMAAESGDDKTSMKLNDVAQALINEGKHDFDARKTWEAWAAGGAERERMAKYCEQDTALLPKLEKETGYLELQQTLATVSYTCADTHGLKPMPQVDGIILRLAHLRGTHLPSKTVPSGEEKPYEGAYVMQPVSLGIHRDVHVCDFASLYPSVIRSLNLGNETKGLPGVKAFGTDVTFGQETESMLAAACRVMMEQRDFWKKKAKADPNDKYAERMNKAFKIHCNSIYGVIGSIWSRFYDREVAESVTLGAKALIMRTLEVAVSRGMTSIYGDTDSAFIKGPSVDEFTAFVQMCNQDVFPAMLRERGADPRWNCIKLDYEKAFDRLVFPMGSDGDPSAKRYFGSYLHYGGKPKTKPEIRGLEYMRSDGVRLGRQMQKTIIDLILKGESNPEFFHEFVRRQRELFFDRAVELDLISKSAAISRELDAYKTDMPHVRAARVLQARGEDVSEGTRVAYVVTDGRVSPSKVIPAVDFDGTTFDRVYYWSKMIYPPTMRVLHGAFPHQAWERWVARYPKYVPPAGQLRLAI